MNIDDALTANRGQLIAAADRWQKARVRRRRHLVLLTSALTAAGIIVGGAIAATGWLVGSPAPPSVKSDFGSYAPQLGFHPDPGTAVLVAQEGSDQLFATTNSEGSYCVVASTAWKRPGTNPDGGTCISKEMADKPIVAGFVAGTANVHVFAGRVSVSGVASIKLPLPDGSTRTIPLGTSGFFLTSIEGQPCQSSDWSPQIEALSEAGTVVAASTITLETEEGNGAACVLPGPHS